MVGILSLISVEVPTVPASPDTAVDFTWLFIKMLLILVIVCVLAILFLKYIMPRTGLMRAMQKGRYFTVMGRYQLEHRKALYLVEVGGRYLVIGCADHGIQMLTELTEEQAVGGEESERGAGG